MTQDITWFTPNVGVTSTELCFIQYFYKNHSSNLRTQLQIFSATLSCALSLQHLSYKTLYALSLQLSSMHTNGT